MGTDQIALQAQVLGLLQNFKGTEPLKELFWSRLNYDRANKPITRRGWADGTAALLHEDPVLLATGGTDDAFRIVYTRLAENRLPLGGERLVVSRLLKDCPYSLFLFSDKSQTHWHFLNVKMAEDESKRKLFRRLTVGPYEQMRTASQVISQLDLELISPNLFGLSPLVIQQRHDQAFDVEPVTEEFFTEYHVVFEKVESLIRGIRDQDQRRFFTQRLFNRLMFIAFIQKKGWLQFGGNKNQDYLNALWSDYKKNGDKEMGFYHERLYTLFFHGLGAQDEVGIAKINRGGLWADYIGKVPYLNGGLFEEDEDDKDGKIKVPDEAIRAILQDLFNHFNFTVTEATPLDIEVAVDPEMLGKVFEELVTGRHETGSYYTPKPIVSFMCREALKGYLESNLPKEKPEGIARFVDEHEPGDLHDGESALEMLRRIRVCDPACGSGAYLLGMLHELIDLRTCLFSAKNIDPISAYDRKLEIIQRNVYGVDIDAFAVNIARLRLWLSLAVEFEGNDPPPLPNLKFEIEEGDSLGAPGPNPNKV
jgi:MmeI, DNA-methyltransferase domain